MDDLLVVVRAAPDPRFGARGRGDLYVRLAVRLPERPGPEERALWEKLRALDRKR